MEFVFEVEFFIASSSLLQVNLKRILASYSTLWLAKSTNFLLRLKLRALGLDKELCCESDRIEIWSWEPYNN